MQSRWVGKRANGGFPYFRPFRGERQRGLSRARLRPSLLMAILRRVHERLESPFPEIEAGFSIVRAQIALYLWPRDFLMKQHCRPPKDSLQTSSGSTPIHRHLPAREIVS